MVFELVVCYIHQNSQSGYFLYWQQLAGGLPNLYQQGCYQYKKIKISTLTIFLFYHTPNSNAIFSQKKKARVEKLYTPTFGTDRASIWLSSKNVNHFSNDVNMPNVSVKFHHFSYFQNHVAFRAILRPEYEGYIRNTIYRCEKDGQTQILVISDF